jgi:hypothetical protein
MYLNDTSRICGTHHNIPKNLSSFVSIIYAVNRETSEEYKTEFFDFFLMILLSALDKQNQVLQSLSRIRLSFIHNKMIPIMQGAHIDQRYEDPNLKYRNGLFYINDSDGDTIIFKKKINETRPAVTSSEEYNKAHDLKIFKKISPKCNRWYDFNARRLHTSTSPVKHDRRMVVSFNYTIF